MIWDAFELMRSQPVDGCLIEFGVWTGNGLESIESYSRQMLGGNIPVYGFDTFEGLPPSEVPLNDNQAIVWRVGGFSDTSMEQVHKRIPTATLIKSLFCDLKPLSEYGINKVRFARIDCDLYEGYRDSLKLLTPHLQVGTALLFDEGVAIPDFRYYESLRDHGARAIYEWQKETGIRLNVVKSVGTECLTTVGTM
jgi:hypothetical protein